MARFIRITVGANAPTGTELTASRAVGSLRERIGSGTHNSSGMTDVLKDAAILFFLLAAVFMS